MSFKIYITRAPENLMGTVTVAQGDRSLQFPHPDVEYFSQLQRFVDAASGVAYYEENSYMMQVDADGNPLAHLFAPSSMTVTFSDASDLIDTLELPGYAPVNLMTVMAFNRHQLENFFTSATGAPASRLGVITPRSADVRSVVAKYLSADMNTVRQYLESMGHKTSLLRDHLIVLVNSNTTEYTGIRMFMMPEGMVESAPAEETVVERQTLENAGFELVGCSQKTAAVTQSAAVSSGSNSSTVIAAAAVSAVAGYFLGKSAIPEML